MDFENDFFREIKKYEMRVYGIRFVFYDWWRRSVDILMEYGRFSWVWNCYWFNRSCDSFVDLFRLI